MEAEDLRRLMFPPAPGRPADLLVPAAADALLARLDAIVGARGVSDVRRRRVMDQGTKLPQLSRVRVLYPASLSFAISARRLLSARESRDLTVPRAQPRIAAVSSSERPRK